MARKKRHKQSEQVRRERRFLPEPPGGRQLGVVTGWVGAALLGAGVYGRWWTHSMRGPAVYLLLGGLLVVGLALWIARWGHPVRVGDAGVAVERGSELERMLWCDVEQIQVRDRRLVLTGREGSLVLPLGLHRRAIAWVLSEAARRIPQVLDVKQSLVDQLPEPRESDGELVDVTDVQVAGRHCAASGKVIVFERDARLCPNCGQVYHQSAVPDCCQTCQRPLGAGARA